MRWLFALGILCVGFGFGSVAHASYIISAHSATSNDQTYFYGDGAGDWERHATKFVATTTISITQGVDNLRKTLLPTDNLILSIYSDAGGAPGTELGTSDSLAASTLTGSCADYSFNFSTPVVVTAGTYWLGIKRDGSRSLVNYPETCDVSGATGSVIMKRNNGSWAAWATDYDFVYSLYGNDATGAGGGGGDTSTALEVAMQLNEIVAYGFGILLLMLGFNAGRWSI